MYTHFEIIRQTKTVKWSDYKIHTIAQQLVPFYTEQITRSNSKIDRIQRIALVMNTTAHFISIGILCQTDSWSSNCLLKMTQSFGLFAEFNDLETIKIEISCWKPISGVFHILFSTKFEILWAIILHTWQWHDTYFHDRFFLMKRVNKRKEILFETLFFWEEGPPYLPL